MIKRLLGGLVAAMVMVLCGASSAFAVSGAPLTIASGGDPEYLSVGVTESGDAVVAWAEKASPGNEVVRYCLTAPAQTSCSGGGTLTPAGGKPGFTYVYETQVVTGPWGVAILADVDVGDTGYESVQEWRSTDGGRSFAAVDGGHALASGNPDADTHMLSAVTLPGGTSLGVGFLTPGEPPTFHAVSLDSPTLCGREDFPATNCHDGYAALASGSDPDQVSNEPGNFAADGNGVLGVFRVNYSSGNLGCSGGSPFGLAYVFGSGSQSPSNNYNASAGAPGTAWRGGVSVADCGVDYLAAGGGPSGFGVLEDNQITGQTQYHRFDEATKSFGTAPVVVSGTGEQQPSVSQDGAGGVYATYLSGGIGGPVSLSYSPDGGTSWRGPVTLASDPVGAIEGLTSTVSPAGLGWVTWIEQGSVHLQQFVAADAGSTPAAPAPGAASSGQASTSLTATQKAGAASGVTISIPAGTTGETDQATIVGANAAHATGTMTYTLYADPACDGSSAISSSTVAVNGSFAAPSAPVAAALAPGKYYWKAAYGGDAANAPSSSACGSQVLTVTAPNTIAATATSDGRTLDLGVGCVEVPCTLEVAATAGTAADTTSSLTDRKAKTVALGKGKFKIKKKGTQGLTLKLSGAGRHYFADKSKAKVSIAVTEKVRGHNVVTRRSVNVKVAHGKPKKK